MCQQTKGEVVLQSLNLCYFSGIFYLISFSLALCFVCWSICTTSPLDRELSPQDSNLDQLLLRHVLGAWHQVCEETNCWKCSERIIGVLVLIRCSHYSSRKSVYLCRRNVPGRCSSHLLKIRLSCFLGIFAVQQPSFHNHTYKCTR